MIQIRNQSDIALYVQLPQAKKPLSMKDKRWIIYEEVCLHHETTIEKIRSKSRKRMLVTARQQMAMLLLLNTKMSLKGIGRELGNRDHSTIVHARTTVTNLCETDKTYKAKFDELKMKVMIKLDLPK